MLWYKKAQSTKNPLPKTIQKNREGYPSFADPKGIFVPPPTPAKNLTIINQITRALHDLNIDELNQLNELIQAGKLGNALGQPETNKTITPNEIPSMQVGPRNKLTDMFEAPGTPAIEHLRRTLPGTAPAAPVLPKNKYLTDREKRKPRLEEGRPWSQ